MNKFLFLILTALGCCLCQEAFSQVTWNKTIASSFGGGTGSENDPYLIHTAEEFAYWAELSKTDNLEGKHVLLTVSITYNNSNADMPAIKYFAGTFDGNANRVEINGCSTDGNGYYYMFGHLDGTVKNLNFSSTSSNAGKYRYSSPASLAYNVNATGLIYNCYIENKGNAYFVAAPVCNYLYGTVENCHIVGSVSSYEGYSDNSSPFMEIKSTGKVVNCMTSFNGGKYWQRNRQDPVAEDCRNPISLTEWKAAILGDDVEYTITYLESGSPELEPSTVKLGTSFTLPQAQHPDLTFAGWYRNGVAVGSKLTVNANVELTAYWKREVISQPTLESPIFSIQDAQDATFQWYVVGNEEQTFEGWTSTNHSDDSSSSHTYSIAGVAGQTLSIDWGVSSEDTYDYMNVYINNKNVLSQSGENSGTYSYTLPNTGEYTIKVVYSKDEGGDDGQDRAWISSIKLSNELIPLDDATSATLSQQYTTAGGTYLCRSEYVSSPAGISHITSASSYWSEPVTFEAQERKQCAKPVIGIEDGEISFACETPNAVFHYTLTSADAGSEATTSQKVSLANGIKVTVYATADGYEPSEQVTSTLPLTVGRYGDLNGDGVITVSDVTTMVNKVLKK